MRARSGATVEGAAASERALRQGALPGGQLPDSELPELDEPTLEAFAALAARLEPRLAQLAQRQAELYRREIPAFASLSDEDLVATAGTINRATLAQLAELTRPTPAEIGFLRRLGRGMGQRGFPLDALARSFQLGSRLFLSILDEEAGELPVDDHLLLVAHDFTWAWANEAVAVVSEAHRDVTVAITRRDSERRADFLRGLLYGTLSDEVARAETPLYGLSSELPYQALRARCPDQDEQAALTGSIMRTGSTSTHRPVLTMLEGDLVGLSPQPPRIEGTGLVGTETATTIFDAPAAFARATEALETARAFGVTGVVELADLGPLPLALAADAAAEPLERRHFANLDAQGRVGREIEGTVRTVLDLDQDLAAVGAALNVHRNTVRYRLGRFRELTGLDIRQTQDLVTAWWLLNRRRARGA